MYQKITTKVTPLRNYAIFNSTNLEKNYVTDTYYLYFFRSQLID